LDPEALENAARGNDSAAGLMYERTAVRSAHTLTNRNKLHMYEGNVKEEQVLKLQAKVEALSKKTGSLLRLLPKLCEQFGVSVQQMTEQVLTPLFSRSLAGLSNHASPPPH
jgi:hypothetical protein